jgi:hypothetical protein
MYHVATSAENREIKKLEKNVIIFKKEEKMRVIEAKVAEKSQLEQKKCIYLKQLVYQPTPLFEYNSYKLPAL